MSRVGRLPIPLPQGVEIAVEGGTVSVRGPKGALVQPLPTRIAARVEEGRLVVRRQGDGKGQKALHGLARALLQNAVTGVTKGWQRELEIHGVGYKAQVTGKTVVLNLGTTHPVELEIPEGIALAVERQTRIRITGTDRQKVGQFAARLRALRPPDVYKQKGVRYTDEVPRKKAGKAGVKA